MVETRERPSFSDRLVLVEIVGGWLGLAIDDRVTTEMKKGNLGLYSNLKEKQKKNNN